MFRSMMRPRLWAAACVMALLQACGGGGGGSDGPSRPTWEVASIGPGGGYSLHHVAYGNGRFVALGNNGIGPNANVNGSSSAVSTSTNDGATWTAQLLALTLNPHDFPPSLNAIEFGADRFVAVSSQGDIVTSVDGQAWTTAVWKAQYEGVQIQFNSVVYGNGRFLAAGGNPGGRGAFMTSTDGLVWSDPQPLPEPLNLDVNLAFLNGHFVAYRGNAIHLSSDNGATWNPVVLMSGGQALDVSYEGGPFQAVGWPGLRLRKPPATWLNRTA